MQHKNIYILMQLTYQFQGQKVRVTRPIIAGHKSKTNKMWYQMGIRVGLTWQPHFLFCKN